MIETSNIKEKILKDFRDEPTYQLINIWGIIMDVIDKELWKK
jgi:hypothetical protein